MDKWRIIRPIIIVVCTYLIITTLQGTVELLKAGDKVTRRENDLVALQKEQQQLIVRKKQAESQDYLDETAYGKLGLSKPGEEVIIIPQELLADHTPVVVSNNEPNWKKWAGLLF